MNHSSFVNSGLWDNFRNHLTHFIGYLYRGKILARLLHLRKKIPKLSHSIFFFYLNGAEIKSENE